MRKSPTSELRSLRSIGPAMVRDFELLGITSIAQLKRSNPQKLYDRLCELTGKRHDPCVLDTFVAAVAQAKNPDLPAEQCDWWYWSRVRKSKAKTAK